MTIVRSIAVALLASLVLGTPLFAGEPDRGHAPSATTIRGTVASVDSSFGARLSNGLLVEVSEDTRWSSDLRLGDLQPGDEIVVIGGSPAFGTVKAGALRVVSSRGRVAPVGSVACLPDPPADQSGTGRIHLPRLKENGDSSPDATSKSEDEIEGVVVTAAAASLEIETDEGARYTVTVDGETEFDGFASLADLDAGDRVRARGELDGAVLHASRVELRSTGGDDDDGDGGDDGDDGGGGGGGGGGDGGGGDDNDVYFESTGVVTDIVPPDSFALSDQKTYRVDGQTVFDEPIVSYSGLSVGQFLEVEAVYEGGSVYRAIEVKYEGDEDQGQGVVELVGRIAAASAEGLTLTDGTSVLFSPSTSFNGDADEPGVIEPGWSVEISALLNVSGEYLALLVRAEDPAPPTTEGQEYEPREAVLVLADGAAPSSVADRFGAEVSGQVNGTTVLLTWPDDIDDRLLAEVEADPEVLAVEPNYLFRDPESVRRRFIVVDRSPTDNEFRGQIAATRHGVAKALSTVDGDGTVVAIMDTGVDKCHPLLQGHLIAGGLDLIDGDFAPWESPDGIDQDADGEVDEAVGHGTFVASIVALAAPGTKILPYRVLDDDGGGTAFDLALALADAIERNVDVINLSLVYRTRSVAVDLLLEEASRRGIVLVAAAGNDQSASLPFPATDSHVLAVTAIRADGSGLADFANRNDKTILAVTGEEIYGAHYGGEYGTSSGTSLAAPFVAAGATLVKELDPSAPPDIVRRLLEQTGNPMTDGAWQGQSLDLGRAVSAASP